jgi:hypothetical protein
MNIINYNNVQARNHHRAIRLIRNRLGVWCMAPKSHS